MENIDRVSFELSMLNVEEFRLRKHVSVWADQLDNSIMNDLELSLKLFVREGLLPSGVDSSTLRVTTACDDVAVVCRPLTELNVTKDVTTLCTAPFSGDKFDAPFMFLCDATFRLVKSDELSSFNSSTNGMTSATSNRIDQRLPATVFDVNENGSFLESRVSGFVNRDGVTVFLA